jgi:hypothetical protein
MGIFTHITHMCPFTREPALNLVVGEWLPVSQTIQCVMVEVGAIAVDHYSKKHVRSTEMR